MAAAKKTTEPDADTTASTTPSTLTIEDVVAGHNYEVGSKDAVAAAAAGNPVMADTGRTWSGQTAAEAAEEAAGLAVHTDRFDDDAVPDAGA